MPVRVFNLDAGDQISAKIVTAGPPDVLAEQQVDAILAKPAAPVAAAPAPPAEAPAASPPVPAAEAAPEPVEKDSKLWLWILLLIILAVLAWLVTRSSRKK